MLGCYGLPNPPVPFAGEVNKDGSDNGGHKYVFSGVPSALLGPTSGVARVTRGAGRGRWAAGPPAGRGADRDL